MGDTVIVKDKPSDDTVVIAGDSKTIVVEEPKIVEKKVVTETHTTETSVS